MKTQELDTKVDSQKLDAEQFEVKDAGTFEAGNARLDVIKALMDEVDSTFDPIVSKAKTTVDAARKTLDEAKTQKERYAGPLTLAKSIIKRKMETWYLAEKKRKEDEDAKLRKLEEEKVLKLASKAPTPEKAEKIVDAALRAAPKQVVELPKAKGFSVREEPDFEITDATKLPNAYMLPDEVKIRRIVKALGKEAEKSIPGIRVFMKAVSTKH